MTDFKEILRVKNQFLGITGRDDHFSIPPGTPCHMISQLQRKMQQQMQGEQDSDLEEE
jgi:hypothetical protein